MKKILSGDCCEPSESVAPKKDNLQVALAGNPNSGKTSLFNCLTGANQKVGNWGGVTVDIRTGNSRHKKETIQFTDLPGTYSLTAYSAEEVLARNFIIDSETDVVLNVVDSTNLERNLYLTVQILEMGKPLMLALNMSDELEKKGVRIDQDLLSRLLGIPIKSTVARICHGINELKDFLIDMGNGKIKASKSIRVNYGRELEKEIKALSTIIDSLQFDNRGIDSRWYAIKILEDDVEVIRRLTTVEGSELLFDQLEKSIDRIVKLYDEDPQTLISEQRYGFIRGAVKEAVKVTKVDRQDLTDRIDKVLTHKWLAYPIFALFMWGLFQTTFKLGEYPMIWLENLFVNFGAWVQSIMAPSGFRDLLVDGIIGGVGSVIIFLPNILILFLGISFLEDTGYMARIAFLMDKVMHKMGLHGKSFIPMIMGIGCSVPAIMSTRTLENRKDRILTILVTPLVTCSARLPVYVLFAGAFFPDQAGNVIFLIYVLSFIFPFLIGLLFRKTLFRKEKESPFVMEMPPYRLPTARSVFIHMWEKGKHYLQRMGGVVLFFSIIIWFLGNYPKSAMVEASEPYVEPIATQTELLESLHAGIENISILSNSESDININLLLEPATVELLSAQDSNAISYPSDALVSLRELSVIESNDLRTLEAAAHAARMESSFIGRIGKFISPVLRPAGFDWRMSVSLVTGFVAKEIVVSTMGVLFQSGENSDEESDTLIAALRRNYTPLQGFAFMIFVLLYTPCLVALITLFNELKSWKWSLFALSYQLILAWTVATLVYRIGILLSG